MSLVTRCPACSTTFRVVRDQLRISDGWVRCGRCSEVFDATIELQEVSDQAPASAAPESPAPAPVDHVIESEAQPESEEVLPGDAEADFLDDEQEPSTTDTAQQEARESGAAPAPPPPNVAEFAADVASFNAVASLHWPDAEALTVEDEGRVTARPPLPPPLSFPDIDLSLSRPVPPPAQAPQPMRVMQVAGEDGPAPSDTVADAQLRKALRRARVKSAKIAKAKARQQKLATVEAAPVVLAASEPEPHEAIATFMPSLADVGEAAGFWQRVAVRRALVALAILAAVVLVGQVLYQERDLIVARQPSSRPMLVAMCKLLGCEISALRQINDIKVDGASFARGKNDEGYQLSFTLRNVTDVPLAMPAVELSLLDTQERAVVRRVIMPPEFGAPAVLPARAERAASLSLKLTGPEVEALPPVAGFRLETLYP